MVALHYHADTLFVVGGKALEKEGSEEDPLLQVVSSFHIPTSCWAYKVKKLPAPLCAFASAMVDQSLFIVGGLTSAGFSDCVYRVDLLKMKSSQVLIEKFTKGVEEAKSVQQMVSASCALTSDRKALIVFGGSTYESETNAVFSIDLQKFLTLEGDITANIVL